MTSSSSSTVPVVGSAAFAAAAAPGYLAWGLALLVVLSRLAFRSEYLYHWDSVNFATALEHYDVRLGQPQAPGYILYVGLCWLVNTVVRDANLTMVLLSAVFSGLLVVALWRFAERFFPEWRSPAGLFAGLLVAANPLLWFYGGVALPHVPDAVLTTWIALLWWRILQKESRLLFPAAILLGIVAGVRQQNLIYLFPLFLFCVRREKPVRILGALAVTGAVCLVWLLPMLQMSGGLAAYVKTSRAYQHDFFSETSLLHGAGLAGVFHNIDRVARYTLYAMAFVGLGLAATLRWWRPALRAVFAGERGGFLLLWIAPSFVFYIVIHMGQHGLIFTFLVPVLLGCSGLLAAAASRARRPVVAALIGSSVAASLFFAAAPDQLGMGGGGAPGAGSSLKVLDADTLRDMDRDMGQSLGVLTRRFPADETLVIARNCRHLSYYLPRYRIAWSSAWAAAAPRTLGDRYAPGAPGVTSLRREVYTLWHQREKRDEPLSRFTLPAGTRYLVLMDTWMPVRVTDPKALEIRQAEDGIRYIALPPAARVAWAAREGRFVVSPF